MKVGQKRKRYENANRTFGPTPASCISSARASSSGLSRKPSSQVAPPKEINLLIRSFVAKLVIPQNVEAIIHRVPIGIIG